MTERTIVIGGCEILSIERAAAAFKGTAWNYPRSCYSLTADDRSAFVEAVIRFLSEE